MWWLSAVLHLVPQSPKPLERTSRRHTREFICVCEYAHANLMMLELALKKFTSKSSLVVKSAFEYLNYFKIKIIHN
jgi:hypothetical protein